MNKIPEHFGEMFKRLRVGSKQTLRSFCLSHGFDPGNVSRLERGRVPPPDSDELLQKYSVALGLKADSPESRAFKDCAYVQRGKIPKDMLSDAELMQKLPILFRTIRDNADTKKALKDFAEELRRV